MNTTVVFALAAAMILSLLAASWLQARGYLDRRRK
jgi:hypothetical protein